jgi:nucleotide-binding universal stress UspA family protein
VRFAALRYFVFQTPYPQNLEPHPSAAAPACICRADGLTVGAEVERGDPAAAIVATAERISADLIVLGTHGKAGWDAFRAGSITPRIADRRSLPVRSA